MRNRVSSLAIATLTLFSGASHGADAPAAARPVLISADRVWTGEGAAHAGWSVLVAQGRIQAVGPAKADPCRPTPSASHCPARP
jgi:hypothetical protein